MDDEVWTLADLTQRPWNPWYAAYIVAHGSVPRGHNARFTDWLLPLKDAFLVEDGVPPPQRGDSYADWRRWHFARPERNAAFTRWLLAKFPLPQGTILPTNNRR